MYVNLLMGRPFRNYGNKVLPVGEIIYKLLLIKENIVYLKKI